ncbi:hypothetical protein LTR56_002349 [Elasticomyces elasticus]|nr:hypothetical protein LTR56_002349 [Elasticomyces elasticus]KAK3665913.1 hypothetical protein LTR22_003232 [Elasticomyces elasticus]KAK4929385.1 hypothetical protein LTR49_003989 [Elasticomyces elasticus]KAK5764674.1 hypothetical protein LTS12_005175 [Elasticomyces elasticus]
MLLKRRRKEGVRPLKFMDLPPEIRDQIYEYALKCRTSNWVFRGQQNEGKIQLNASKGALKSFSLEDQHHPATQPSLTRVSRQLRAETLAMYYGINSFELRLDQGDDIPHVKAHNVEQMQALKWLAAIGPSNAQLIKNIKILYAYESISQLEMDRLMNTKPLSTVAAVAVLDGDWYLVRAAARMGR